MTRKMDAESKHYATFDELPSVVPCILASIEDAEKNNTYEYGLLTPHYYMTVQNGEIMGAINRSSFTLTRIKLRSLLARGGFITPRKEYLCSATIQEDA